MKRDMDVIRALMLKLESKNHRHGAFYTLSPWGEELALEGVDPDIIAGHMDLLIDA